MATFERSNLSGRHQDTLRQIFAHPLSHNVEWHSVVALLHEVATVAEGPDGKVEVAVGDQKVVLARPRNKDLDADELVSVRHLLESLGYSPTDS
jgi:hypothetical protein